jgi:hypothetical protein
VTFMASYLTLLTVQFKRSVVQLTVLVYWYVVTLCATRGTSDILLSLFGKGKKLDLWQLCRYVTRVTCMAHVICMHIVTIKTAHT